MERLTASSIQNSLSLWQAVDSIREKLDGGVIANVARRLTFCPGETVSAVSHRRVEVILVKHGGGNLTVNNCLLSLQENEIVFLQSNVEHRFKAGTAGCTLFQLEFLPQVVGLFSLDESPWTKVKDYVFVPSSHAMAAAVENVVVDLSEGCKYCEYMSLMHFSELMILFTRFVEQNHLLSYTNEALQKCISYFHQHYQSDISMADVAEYSGVSERYLRKLFSQYVQLSPVDYLNQLRIERAADLLRNSELSIKEICYDCGFQSPQYFSRVFKNQKGVTPKSFKN